MDRGRRPRGRGRAQHGARRRRGLPRGDRVGHGSARRVRHRCADRVPAGDRSEAAAPHRSARARAALS